MNKKYFLYFIFLILVNTNLHYNFGGPIIFEALGDCLICLEVEPPLYVRYFLCVYASPTRVTSPLQRILGSRAWQ